MSDQPTEGEATREGTPTAVALRRLRAPDHGSSFWSDLDTRLADEPQLRLAPRAAIRPITQPPPVIDDRHLAKSLAGGTTDGAPPRRSSRRLLTVLVVAVATLLVLAFVFREPDDETATARDADSRSESSADQAAASNDDEATTTTLPTTTLPPGTIDPAEPMDPAGVGPLRIGATLGDLQAQGFQIQPDQAMFRSSGGTCYVARVTGALDLRLRFRNADGTRRAADPAEGVLAAISIDTSLPTHRLTSGTGIGLGSPQDQILAAYGQNLDERHHPFAPQGKVYRADAGNGLGTAFETDGATVIGMSVGQMDVIRFVNQCN